MTERRHRTDSGIRCHFRTERERYIGSGYSAVLSGDWVFVLSRGRGPSRAWTGGGCTFRPPQPVFGRVEALGRGRIAVACAGQGPACPLSPEIGRAHV